MLRWYPPPILQIALELSFVPIAILSVFALNAFINNETPWQIGWLTGPGRSSDLAIVISLLGSSWVMLFLGWRGAKTAFKALFLLWNLGFAIGSWALALQTGNLLFAGEAIGFQVSIELFAPVFATVTMILAVWWMINDSRRDAAKRSVSPFQRKNWLALALAVIGALIAAISFWQKVYELGTIAGILTAIAVREWFRPLNPSRELHKALTAEGSTPK